MNHPFLVALQFLTRLPIPKTGKLASAKIQGRSVLYYPIIGLMLGLLSILLAYGLEDVLPNALIAFFILAFGVTITGALHLDGLADSADAWLGGHGNKQRCLDIMRDPRCGPAGVIALFMVLLAKFSAYESIIAQTNGFALIVAPLLARTAVIALFLSTPYVRAGGIGETLSQYMPKTAAYGVILTSAFVVLLFFNGFWPLIFAGLLFYLLRRQMLLTLDGATGDTTGAMIEIMETGVLIAALIKI
ncbi:MAG: adenosylcobinamide-GDP ribazoletransferase [Thiohalomonadales bacterium]